MIKKILFVFFFSLLIQKVAGQKTVFEFEPNFDKEIYATYPIVNNENNELLILFDTKNKYHTFLFNSDFEEISKINFDRLPKRINIFLGYTIQADNYFIIFKNSSSTKFAVVSINFKDKTSSHEIIDFSLNSEKLLDVFNFKNKLHLISTKFDSKSFNIYVYEDGNFKKNPISINGENEDKPYAGTAYDLLVDQKFTNTGDNMKIIDNKIPNSIAGSNYKAKFYINEESFTITFDKEKDITRVISIDPNSFEVSRSIFYHSKNRTQKIKNSNSYIFGDKLFQSASSYDFLKLTITDINTKKVIKEFLGNNLQDIYFKNGSINQYKTDLLGGKRELTTSKKFLRKISKGMQGISVFNVKGNYKVSIGSVKPVTFSGGGSGWSTSYNGSGVPTMQYNPSLQGSSDQKTVWINCIFDKDFNHQEGEVKDFIPKRILNFEKNTTIKRKSIFKFQNKMYRGVFILSLNRYRISHFL
ncbi:hypothetical protein [Aquimarina rubra]|uniref:Uncharacterized protein n=1 Tax=Aquimarina rubra TaxID=1920033 RepID=A0ABW5LGY1_9FLAO